MYYSITLDYVKVPRPSNACKADRPKVQQEWKELNEKLKAAGYDCNKRYVDKKTADVELKRLRTVTRIKTLIVSKCYPVTFKVF